MVGTARFELATPCTPSKCATRLRYVPTESAAQDDDDSVRFDLQILHQAAATGHAPLPASMRIPRRQGLTSITNERDGYHHGATASCGNMINVEKSGLWNHVRFFRGDPGVGRSRLHRQPCGARAAAFGL